MDYSAIFEVTIPVTVEVIGRNFYENKTLMKGDRVAWEMTYDPKFPLPDNITVRMKHRDGTWSVHGQVESRFLATVCLI